MTHNAILSQCLPRDNCVGIATRIRHAVSLATSLRSLTRANRPAAPQEPGAQALPVEPATWICPGASIVLPASVRQTIACDAGTVWITQGDCEDYVLTAGQCLALTPADDVIVSAMAAPAVVRRIFQ